MKPTDPGAQPQPHAEGSEPEGWRTTRRAFLAYSAVGTGVAVAGLPGPAAGAEGAPTVRGPGEVPITLRVNGARRTVKVLPSTTLAEALRERLGLTGTKIGCDRGACSACTVLLDGTPVSSCLTFALDVGDREVTTIEGLARGEALHPLQEAFVAHDALQCGFCTPGMVMSCAALLARNPAPTLDDVKAAVAGNTCRCGTYPKVFEAVLAAAGQGLTRK
jgi:xanthine dehydrogenase YagT iron-sulfur-binding subunit